SLSLLLETPEVVFNLHKCPRVCTASPEDSNGAPATTSRAPVALAGHGSAQGSPSMTASDGKPASLASEVRQLPPKLDTYSSCGVSSNPELLIVGDSIVRYLTLPGAITYCLSGGKVVYIVELIPTLIDLHPSVKFVLAHVGTNDVMARNSSKLHADLESLCYTVESLGRRCLMSGPIPTFSKNSERFSRLFSLHIWLKNFCSAAGYDFISNFDYFWTNSSLYRSDGLHPNRKGTKQLTDNFIQFIAFSS
uniref:SGNH hydrolase-type esterase domain-containing protein n=1 Tax=Sparus aurata TaxID=8175 RepID=A0A671TMH6_SPAAU